MNIISEVISAVGDWITGIFGWLISAVDGVVSIFYDSTEGLTLVGVLLLFGLAMSLVFFAFKFIMSLIRK
ncbi:MAG: hypothetical protein QXI16_04180 [Sulfolobaceae archaeon]